jgi:hypothetical protein
MFIVFLDKKVALMTFLELSNVEKPFLHLFLDLVAVKFDDGLCCDEEGFVAVDLVQEKLQLSDDVRYSVHFDQKVRLL